ncbi:MAG: hypothetical protein ACI884_001422, partial [Ulvibacter sp.]
QKSRVRFIYTQELKIPSTLKIPALLLHKYVQFFRPLEPVFRLLYSM